MDASARIGTTLRGKWRLDGLLGTGGFAAVYSATHRAGKRVAIKVLHPTLNASAEARRRFLKEAYAANAVDHPSVVGVSDDDVTDDGAAFLVMDLLEGDTLEASRRRAGGKLDLATTLIIAEQVLDGLAAAHEKAIIHRDLKPENLFLTRSNQVKILDFGIARFREPGDESTATQTGLTMGSPAFMAPEQARGRWSEVDARTDIYSLGATLFTLLSGQLVHGKGNMNETLIAAATRPVPPLASMAPDVPQAVALVIDRALAFDKTARWPDARSMQAAVRAARDVADAAGNTVPLTAAPVSAAPGTSTPITSAPITAPPVTSAPLAAPPPGFSPTAPPTLPIGPDYAAISAGPPITTPAGVVSTSAPRPSAKSPAAVAMIAIALCLSALAIWWTIRTPSATTPDPTAPPSSMEPASAAFSSSPTASDSPAATSAAPNVPTVAPAAAQPTSAAPTTTINPGAPTTTTGPVASPSAKASAGASSPLPAGTLTGPKPTATPSGSTGPAAAVSTAPKASNAPHAAASTSAKTPIDLTKRK